MRRLATIAALALGLALLHAGLVAGAARAQRAHVTVQSRQLNAGTPFVLTVTDEGFEESPTPEVAAFQVPGCKVDSLGAMPSVSSSITIINGRRSESREVRFEHRFQVLCEKAGTYQLPALTVKQGSKTARTQAGRFQVREVQRTDKMALRLGLPDRPLAPGETFDLTVDWYLAADPDDPSFSIPIFDRPDEFEVTPPPARQPGDRDAVPFSIGGREVELPFTREQAQLDGAEYTRFRFTAQVTPLKPGTFRLPAARVTARLAIGEGRDAFGFRVARKETFKAEDQPRAIEVAPLPLQGQPPGFSGAVGEGFSIEVRASQTVVRVGDPIELEILVRGAGHLEGIGLPDLDGPAGLPREDFGAPATPPTGQVTEDGKAKRFAVTVRLLRPVTQVPPIQFAYWNPVKRAYETATSQAIALSVDGARAIGAGDVLAGAPEQAGVRRPTPELAPGTGADLSPSAPDRTMRQPWTMDAAAPIVAALYGAPTLLLVFGFTRRRLRRRGQAGSESRAARGELDRALDAARSAPARDAVPAIVAALRALLRAAGQPTSRADDLVADLENRAFDPKSAGAPLPADLIARARDQAAAWRGRGAGPGKAGAAGLTLALLVGAAGTAAADPVADARGAYQAALGQADRAARTRAFGRAQSLYRDLAAGAPDRPELLTDWGNAALGAADLGTAVLAYRRALRVDPGLDRARTNLAWVRGQLPGWAAASDEGGAIDSLLFWHRRMTTAQKHLLAAASFAAVVLLLLPLGARRRLRRGVAVVPAVVAIAMWGSLVAEPDVSSDAVVVADGVVLRAADHPGAPAVLAEPVPAGAETTVLEERDAWERVSLAGGATGWLPAGALARVEPRD